MSIAIPSPNSGAFMLSQNCSCGLSSMGCRSATSPPAPRRPASPLCWLFRRAIAPAAAAAPEIRRRENAMDDAVDSPSQSMWLDLLGVGPERERLSENLAAYRSILDEIRKLRTLDLADIHPVVVFDPSLPYRRP